MRFLIGQRFRARLALFHDELVECGIDGEGIVAIETGETKLFTGLSGRAHHSFDVEIAETVDAEIFADLIHRHLIGDQFFRIGKIDAVMAGETVRRATHAHVNFLRAGFAQVHDARARGRAAHNRIIHHDDAFSRHHFLDQVQFHAHIEIADELARLQETCARCSDCAQKRARKECSVPAQNRVPRNFRSPARAHDVGFDRKFAGQFASHFGSHFGDIDAADDAVGPREIDVFEHAKRRLLIAKWPLRAQTVFVE